MNCKDYETLWIPYLDGKLAPGPRETVELHLSACAVCADRVKGFSEVFGMLGEWPGIEPSPSFNARLEQRLAQEAKAASGWEVLLWPVRQPVLAVAMLAVISLAVVLLRYSPAPPEIATSQPNQPVEATLVSEVDEMALYRNLHVLEDWEVLRNFEVLQELSSANQLQP